MTKKLAIYIIAFISISAIMFNFITINNTEVKLAINAKLTQNDTLQVFYTFEDEDWSEEQSYKLVYTSDKHFQEFTFDMPQNIKNIRIDCGTFTPTVEIASINVIKSDKKFSYKLSDFNDDITLFNQISTMNMMRRGLAIDTIGQDPFFVISMQKLIDNSAVAIVGIPDILKRIIFSIFAATIGVFLMSKWRSITSLLRGLVENRKLIWSLSKNDFKTKYVGSYLGIVWAFVNPIITILIYWVVFEFGLKATAPIQGVPFILWFMAGIIPWFYFSEALSNATSAYLEYSYLVKKVVFKVSIIPIIKIISATLIHLVFICVLIAVGAFYGFISFPILIQLLYYSFCGFVFVLSLSYASAAIVLFFRDLSQIIGILLQMGMWITPIMWSYTIVPDEFRFIVYGNPIFYIVQGYRDTVIYHIWFYTKIWHTLYFWSITLLFLGIGALIFRKLKPHFSDVL